jgi:hypothetical protein
MPDPKSLLQEVVDLAAAPGIATDIGGIPNDLTAAHAQTEAKSKTDSDQQKGSTDQAHQPGKPG